VARRLGALLPVAVLVLAGAPAVALAQSALNPLSPGLPAISTPTATTPTVAAPVTTTSSSGGGSFSGTDAIAVAGGALVLLVGISFFIWRDARRRAPTRGRVAAATAGDGPRAGTKPRPKPRKPSPAERRRRKRGRAR
jgi:hypothetical protein